MAPLFLYLYSHLVQNSNVHVLLRRAEAALVTLSEEPDAFLISYAILRMPHVDVD